MKIHRQSIRYRGHLVSYPEAYHEGHLNLGFKLQLEYLEHCRTILALERLEKEVFQCYI
jgi:hypothetical protein